MLKETTVNYNKDNQKLALMPQNIEAEESIFSSILLDNKTLFEVVEILTAEDFYSKSHQMIFSAIEELFSNNIPIDLLTLSNALEKKGYLERIGGSSYLANIITAAPIAQNAKYYAQIIHEKASLRRLIKTSNEITNQCFSPTCDVGSLIDFAEKKIFEIAESKSNKDFHQISDVINKSIYLIEERQKNKALITGITTGFSKLDTMTSGLQKSDLLILAARPSMGKTAFALNLAVNAALENNVPVAFYSLEMSKEQLVMRILCSEARTDSTKVRGGFINKEEWENITNAASSLYNSNIFIDDSPDISIMEIRTKARRLKMDKGLGLVIIDYLQLMKARTAYERRDLEISDISRNLKSLAKELDIPVIALSQLNRKLEERSDKRPMLSDLRESGALEQDADVVMFIYRDEVYNKDENNPNHGKAEIIIAKQRNGPVGTANLAFLHSYTRFENLAAEASSI